MSGESGCHSTSDGWSEAMEHGTEGATPGGIKRASLLGLPAELRIPIYRELFRVKSWEAHQARARDVTAPKRRLSDQCPVCQCVRNDRDCLYPACRLVLKNGEPALAPTCYAPLAPDERRNRCAIIRACRTTYAEAESFLYANTPFVMALQKRNSVGMGARNIGLASVAHDEPEWKMYMPLSKIQILHLRIDFYGGDNGDLVSQTMKAVWQGREQAKLRLKLSNAGQGVVNRILLTTEDKRSSHTPFRGIFYGLAIIRSPVRDAWHSFVLQNALPQYVLHEVDSIATSEDQVDDIWNLDILLDAFESAQGELDLV